MESYALALSGGSAPVSYPRSRSATPSLPPDAHSHRLNQLGAGLISRHSLRLLDASRRTRCRPGGATISRGFLMSQPGHCQAAA